jgi:WD40 repeat protein
MKYKTFISYRHTPFSQLRAERLERAIKRYARPIWKPPMAVFRDERVLRPGDDLPKEIREGLETSEFLIYLASKEAASSEWIQDELRIWCQELKRSNRLLIVHISDRLGVDLDKKQVKWGETDAIPASIREYVTSIPMWSDLAWATKEEHLDLSNIRFKGQINALVAALRDILPAEMNDVEVLTHRRNILIRNGGIGVVAASAALAVWFGIRANQSAAVAQEQRTQAVFQARLAEERRREAVRQTAIAVEQQQRAERETRIAEDQRDSAVAAQLIAQSNELDQTQPWKFVESASLLLKSAVGRATPEGDFALRDKLGQLARPVWRNGYGSPLVGITFFFDGMASLRKDYSGELRYFPWPDGNALGPRDSTDGIARARVRQDDTNDTVLVAGRKVAWQRHRGFEEVASFPADRYRVFDVAFAKSGQPRVAGTRDGKTVVVSDFGDEQHILTIPGEIPVDGLIFSADARWLAAAHFHRTAEGGPASWVAVFDAQTGQEWTRLEAPEGTMSDFAFSPTGKQAAALAGLSVVQWDLGKASVKRTLDNGRTNFGSEWARVFFSADGKSLGAAGDNRLRIWDTATGARRLARDLDGVIRWLRFDDEKADLVAVADGGGNIEVWDTERVEMTAYVPEKSGRPLLPLRFGHVDQMLQVADLKGNAQLWQIKDQQETWHWHQSPLTWLPDSSRFLVSELNEFYLWDAVRSSVTVSNHMPARVIQLAARPDGKRLAVADEDGWVQLFELPNLFNGFRVKAGTPTVDLEWAPDGKSLAAISGKQLWLWSGDALLEEKVEQPANVPGHLVFSPDGRYFTVAHLSSDGNRGETRPLQLWETKTGKVVRQVEHGQLPRSVAFVRDSPYLISEADGLVRVWQYPELREVKRWAVSAENPSISVSRDGSAVTGIVEGKIGVWRIPSGQSLATITPDGEAQSVAFTPDSGAIVGTLNIENKVALAEAWSWPEQAVITRFPVEESRPAISFSPDGAYLVFRQGNGIQRYLWRTRDLITQGCRTMAELTLKSAGLPEPCNPSGAEAGRRVRPR